MPNDESQAITDLLTPYRKLLEAGGVTGEFLVQQIWAELHADKTSLQKVKGEVEDLDAQTSKVVAQSKKRRKGEDGKPVSEVVETIVAVNEIAWDVRQKARMDAHRIRGDYPAEKYQHSGPNGGPIEHAHTIESLPDEMKVELHNMALKIGEAVRGRSNNSSGA